MRALLPALLLTACSHGPAPSAASPTSEREQANPVAAKCMRRVDRDRGAKAFAEKIYFDKYDNVLMTEREDRKLTITWHRNSNGSLKAYEVATDEPMKGIEGTFQYGPHGELLATHIRQLDHSWDVLAQLEWSGAFASADGIARPFAPLGGPGGLENGRGVPEQFLSANLAVRSPANPMPPLRFTGTVLVTVPSREKPDRYTYEDGRLASLEYWEGSRSTYTWNGDDLVASEECMYDSMRGMTEEELEPPCVSSTYAATSSTTATPTGALDVRSDEQGRPIAGSYAGTSDGLTWEDCPARPN